jgi:membrane protein
VPVWRLLRETALQWKNDNILRLSAALAYYAIFALSPVLVIVLSLAGSAFGDEAVRGQLDEQLRGLMGDRAASTVQDMVASAMHPRKSVIATVLGIIMLVFAATSLFAEMQHSLNVIWGAEKQSDPGSSLLRDGIVSWFRTRLLSLGMVLVILFLLLVSLVFTGVFAFLASHLRAISTLPVALWGLLGFVISCGGEVMLFALLFKVLPDVKFAWRHVWWGAITTAALFEAGKWALAWYLGQEAVVSSYGAAGSIVLLLLWVYYTAIIILTGAELTQVRARLYDEVIVTPK